MQVVSREIDVAKRSFQIRHLPDLSHGHSGSEKGTRGAAAVQRGAIHQDDYFHVIYKQTGHSFCKANEAQTLSLLRKSVLQRRQQTDKN